MKRTTQRLVSKVRTDTCTAGDRGRADGCEPLRSGTAGGGGSASGAAGAGVFAKTQLEGAGIGGAPEGRSGEGGAGAAIAGGDDNDAALDRRPAANGELDLCLQPVA